MMGPWRTGRHHAVLSDFREKSRRDPQRTRPGTEKDRDPWVSWVTRLLDFLTPLGKNASHVCPT